MFKNLKIGKRITLGNAIILLIFIVAAVYQYYQVIKLGDLQDFGAKRNNDAFEVESIASNFEGIYSNIADAIINQNIKEFEVEINNIEFNKNNDLKKLNILCDTGEEKKQANDFENVFNDYISIMKFELLPALKANKSQSEISVIDEKIDNIRKSGLSSLKFIFNSLKAETVVSDTEFDNERKQINTVSIITNSVAFLMVLLISQLLAKSITKPINNVVILAKRLAAGNFKYDDLI